MVTAVEILTDASITTWRPRAPWSLVAGMVLTLQAWGAGQAGRTDSVGGAGGNGAASTYTVTQADVMAGLAVNIPASTTIAGQPGADASIGTACLAPGGGSATAPIWNVAFYQGGAGGILSTGGNGTGASGGGGGGDGHDGGTGGLGGAAGLGASTGPAGNGGDYAAGGGGGGGAGFGRGGNGGFPSGGGGDAPLPFACGFGGGGQIQITYDPATIPLPRPVPLSLTETQTIAALVTVLGSFGLVAASADPTVAAQSIPIIKGQVNRVPEPASPDFVVLWPISRERLAMNIDALADCQITGSITGNVLTVASVQIGMLQPVGQTVTGANVSPGCQVIGQLTGPTGGPGTYLVTATADVGSGKLALGTLGTMQETEVTIQADVHGPASADNAARLTALFRDQFAVSAFDALGLRLAPLYATNRGQIPFTNAEDQWEDRWVIDLCMQANPVATVPQPFADELVTTVTPVDLAAVA